MMLDLRIEKLRQEYTGRYVTIQGDRPEYRRFRGHIGQVRTINMNGQALVQWVDSADRGWYDLDLDFLRIVERPVSQIVSPEQ